MRGSKPGGGNVGKVVSLPGMSGAPKANPVPDPPRHLSPQAQEFWRTVAPELAAEGRLKPLYMPQFENLARLAGLLRQLETADPTFKDARGDEQRAELYWMAKTRNGEQMKAHRIITDVPAIIAKMNPIMTLFGMNPIDNARIDDPGQGNLFDQLSNAINGTSGDAP